MTHNCRFVSDDELSYVKTSIDIQDHLKAKWVIYQSIGGIWRKRRKEWIDVNIVSFIMKLTNELREPIHRLDIDGLADLTGDPEKWLAGLFARMLLGLHSLDQAPK